MKELILDLKELTDQQSNEHDKAIVVATIEDLKRRTPLDLAYAISEDVFYGIPDSNHEKTDADILRTILYRLWEEQE